MKNLRSILYGATLLFVLTISGYQFFTAQKQKATAAITQTAGPTTQTPTKKTNEQFSYTFLNKKMFVTFNNGLQWLEVPATMDEFFSGEYATANSNELLPDSYLLTAERSGLIIAKDNNSTDHTDTVSWLQTTDQGKTWQDYPIFTDFPGIRFRKIQFFNDVAYAFASGGRVMGQEGISLAVSHDDGATWNTVTTTGLKDPATLVQTAGFVNETLGFISRKEGLFVTQDSGANWQAAQIQVPETYQQIFLIAELPYEENGQLLMKMNQGDQGDYKGGNVKGLFQSTDNGLTWTFVAESEEN
ncbi:WD40/YVTN/BNR-like repeat-containing protein [Enterococcus nangangensis]